MAALIACFGGLLALVLASPSPSAQEAGESVNLRVQELVDTGQGVLLPLGDALGTAPVVLESSQPEATTESDAGDVANDEADTAGEQAESIVRETADTDLSMAQTEVAGDVSMAPDTTVVTTGEQDVDTWPPPPEEVVVPDFDEQPAAGVRIVKGMESEIAQPTIGQGDAATDDTAEAAQDEALPPAVEETTVSALETESVAEQAPADLGQSEPAAQEAAGETEAALAVEEPAAPSEASDSGLDAGPVPLRSAELGNADSIGPYRLWLASYRTVREAKDGWQELAMAHQDLLADLTPIIVLKDLGADEGTFFRLQAGPLQTQASAVARCDGLKDQGLYCTVLGP